MQVIITANKNDLPKQYAKSAAEFKKLERRANNLDEKYDRRNKPIRGPLAKQYGQVAKLCETAAGKGLYPTEERVELPRLIKETEAMNKFATGIRSRAVQWTAGVAGLAGASVVLFSKTIDAQLGTSFSALAPELKTALRGLAVIAETYYLCKFLSPIQRLVHDASSELKKLGKMLLKQSRN